MNTGHGPIVPFWPQFMNEVTREIVARPLTVENFAAFGELLEIGGDSISINDGSAVRYNALGNIDVEEEQGRAIISMFRGQSFAMPFCVKTFERHPLGSQAFFPISNRPYLVVVADSDDSGGPINPFVFLAQPGQGINLLKGTWHHPLIALEATSDFLIVDRLGNGVNLEEVTLPQDSRFLAVLPNIA